MKPSVIMIAGPNGAGKTSAAMTLLPDLHLREFVNADEIARGLSPYGKTFRKKFMSDKQTTLSSLHDVLGPALHKAFLRAAELAKQTRTYLVVLDEDKVRHVPYNEIDAFVAKRSIFKGKR